jgi:hypothetical protein
MKPLTAIFFFIFFNFSLLAQILPSKNALQTDIAKVISDYPGGFKNISGEQILNNRQTIEFESKIPVKESIRCHVINTVQTQKIFIQGRLKC